MTKYDLYRWWRWQNMTYIPDEDDKIGLISLMKMTKYDKKMTQWCSTVFEMIMMMMARNVIAILGSNQIFSLALFQVLLDKSKSGTTQLLRVHESHFQVIFTLFWRILWWSLEVEGNFCDLMWPTFRRMISDPRPLQSLFAGNMVYIIIIAIIILPPIDNNIYDHPGAGVFQGWNHRPVDSWRRFLQSNINMIIDQWSWYLDDNAKQSAATVIFLKRMF